MLLFPLWTRDCFVAALSDEVPVYCVEVKLKRYFLTVRVVSLSTFDVFDKPYLCRRATRK